MFAATNCAIAGDTNSKPCKKFYTKNKYGLYRGYKACIGCMHRLEKREVILV